ncbi:MAG: DUF3667 domain-containing protein [Pseudomonadota bacterium]
MSATSHPFACANCGTPLNGSFCHACGQRAHVHTSLLHLGEEFLHGLLHFDAKGLRTLPMLVAKPGQLTRRYIDGQRTRFVSPLALFLFMVVTMFFVASVTDSKWREQSPEAVARLKVEFDASVLQSQARVDRARTALAAIRQQGGEADSAQEELDDALEMLASMQSSRKELDGPGAGQPRRKSFSGWKKFDDASKHVADNPDLTAYKFKSAGSKYSFLLVPLSLPFLWLLFWRRRDVTMYDHAVFTLYSLSFMALLSSLLFVLVRFGMEMLAMWAILGVPPIHMYAQLRGTYKLGRWSALWRAGALLCIAASVLALYMVILMKLSAQ